MDTIQMGSVTYELHRVYTGGKTIPELVRADLLRRTGQQTPAAGIAAEIPGTRLTAGRPT